MMRMQKSGRGNAGEVQTVFPIWLAFANSLVQDLVPFVEQAAVTQQQHADRP